MNEMEQMMQRERRRNEQDFRNTLEHGMTDLDDQDDYDYGQRVAYSYALYLLDQEGLSNRLMERLDMMGQCHLQGHFEDLSEEARQGAADGYARLCDLLMERYL